MGIIRTVDRSVNPKSSRYRVRSAADVNNVTSAPVVNSAGSVFSSVLASNGAWPSPDLYFDTLGLLIVESSGDDATTSPAGWTHVPGSPAVDIADATGTKLNVLWRFYNGDGSSVSIADAGDHVIGRLVTFNGVSRSGMANCVAAASTTAVASTSVNWPSINTPSNNCLIVCIGSVPPDTTVATLWSGFTNANLSDVTDGPEAASAVGNGGNFVYNTGVLASFGSTGVSTGTLSTAYTHSLITLALPPSRALGA